MFIILFFFRNLQHCYLANAQVIVFSYVYYFVFWCDLRIPCVKIVALLCGECAHRRFFVCLWFCCLVWSVYYMFEIWCIATWRMRRLTFFLCFLFCFSVWCVYFMFKIECAAACVFLTVNMLITWPLFYNARSATLSLPRVAGNRNRNRERMTPEAVAAIATMKEATPEAVLLHCNLSGLNSGAKIGWQWERAYSDSWP